MIKIICVFVTAWSWGVFSERIYNAVGAEHLISIKADFAWCLVQSVALIIFLVIEWSERRAVAAHLEMFVQEINGRFMDIKKEPADEAPKA